MISGVIDGLCAREAAGGFGGEFDGEGGTGEVVERLKEGAPDDGGDVGVLECGVDVGGKPDALVDVGGLGGVPCGSRGGWCG